jgi:phospholipase/carboxylesterase
MDSELLDALEVGAERPDYSIIWLHGLGADGYDFEPLVPELHFANKDRTRFVFPHAPHRPVSINAGMRMPAWYDIVGIDEHAPEDENGIRASAAQLEALIAQQQDRGVVPGRIVLAGFSQGGAVALHTALRHGARLAGVLALSTYLPLRENVAAEASDASRGMPIFMAHGVADPVVPLHLAERTRELLQQQGYSIAWHAYEMDHTVIPQEIDDISRWLDGVLNGV